MNNYKITCKKCDRSDNVAITKDNQIMWGNAVNIISGRLRLDNYWGWQCIMCGNNSLLTKQEQKEITNKQAPDPKELQKVLKNIKPEPDTRFDMQRV